MRGAQPVYTPPKRGLLGFQFRVLLGPALLPEAEMASAGWNIFCHCRQPITPITLSGQVHGSWRCSTLLIAVVRVTAMIVCGVAFKMVQKTHPVQTGQ